MTPIDTLADALCWRVNRRGIGHWLDELAAHWDVDATALKPRPPKTPWIVISPDSAIRIVLRHPHAGDVDVGDDDRWLVVEAVFDGDVDQALPFGLERSHETPESAAIKLDAAGSEPREDRRQSFVRDDALVVDLRWRAGHVGIERVTARRLGSELLA